MSSSPFVVKVSTYGIRIKFHQRLKNGALWMRVGRAELCVGLTFEGLSFSCVRDSPLHVLNVREAASQVEWHYSNAIRAPRTSACRRSRSVAWSETDGADTHTINSTHEFHVTRPQVSFSNLLHIFCKTRPVIFLSAKNLLNFF